jgi:multidrug resistance efflux pump
MNKSLLQDKLSDWLYDNAYVGKGINRFLTGALILIIVFLFLPWVQNIETIGTVNTFLPEERPQEVQTFIAGRIAKWKVKEGDYVKKGDTIAVLDEINSEYLNPDLLNQTEIQIQAKEQSVLSYNSKIGAINKQITQLESNRDLSLQKARNKIEQEALKLKAEQAELVAAVKNAEIAKRQFERDSILGLDVLRSPVEIENRRVKWQEAIAKQLTLEAKVRIAQNSYEMAKIELQNVRADYGEKLAKTESERFSAISGQLETEAEISKLRNTYSSYSIRNGFYIITAPQTGLITQTLIRGLGETVKAGDAICTIVPGGATLSVEMKVKPVDLPLFQRGEDVQFVFDGWPTIVFSGWPQATYGTFPGTVYAIDNAIDAKGEYRVLVKPNFDKKPWPKELRVGVGARGYVMLNRVPMWYEIWRNINGFPSDFYKTSTNQDSKIRKKTSP